jgi:hypothetical protein
MLFTYTYKNYTLDYLPSVLDDTDVTVFIENTPKTLCLHDTFEQLGFAGLDPLIYNNASLVLICFSVENLSSFENVKIKVSFYEKNFYFVPIFSPLYDKKSGYQKFYFIVETHHI